MATQDEGGNDETGRYLALGNEKVCWVGPNFGGLPRSMPHTGSSKKFDGPHEAF